MDSMPVFLVTTLQETNSAREQFHMKYALFYAYYI